MEERHEKWMAQFGRVYKDAAEKAYRFEIFKANVEYIESVNSAGNRKYKLGANQFADLTSEEFKATYNRFKPASKLNAVKVEGTRFKYQNFTVAPASMDWRTKGAVTPIKNQGQCGNQNVKIYAQFPLQICIYLKNMDLNY